MGDFNISSNALIYSFLAKFGFKDLANLFHN